MVKKEFYIKESLKLFLKHGIRSVTIGQITKQLNVSSKTIYVLFEDKTGLVYECFNLYKANTKKAFDEQVLASENVADMLIRFYHQAITGLSKVNPRFFNDLARYFPEIWDADDAFGIDQTKHLLQKGIQEGIFYQGMDQNLCAETITLLLRSIFDRETFQQSPTQQLLDNILWPYLRGICTPEGQVAFREYRRKLMTSA
ncbi:MAG: TetR/AcrR family transcriptional regulator [Bacteroidota bacterium]